MSSRASESEFPISLRGAFFEDRHDRKSYDALAAELQAALAREATCLKRRMSCRGGKPCWPRSSSIGSSTACS